jgi:hypothetical protein
MVGVGFYLVHSAHDWAPDRNKTSDDDQSNAIVAKLSSGQVEDSDLLKRTFALRVVICLRQRRSPP